MHQSNHLCGHVIRVSAGVLEFVDVQNEESGKATEGIGAEAGLAEDMTKHVVNENVDQNADEMIWLIWKVGVFWENCCKVGI